MILHKQLLRLACVLSVLALAPIGAQAQSVYAVQTALAAMGYDPGPADGLWGGQTRRALEDFYASKGREFDGKLTNSVVGALRRELRSIVRRSQEERQAVQFNALEHFDREVVIVPAEYAFSKGSSSPANANHAYTVPYPYAHDFNGDGCTDVLSQFGDSYEHPRIIYGNSEGVFEPVLEEQFPASSTISSVSTRDANGDGIADFVGFTASHRLQGRWFTPGSEPDLVALTGQKASYLPTDTYAHGGLVGDVDGDGVRDIFPIQEDPQKARYAIRGNGSGGFGDRFRVNALSDAVVFSGKSGDLNGDGVDDFAILTAKRYGDRIQVTPATSGNEGTFAVALGEPGKTINELDFVPYGQHPLSEQEWALYLFNTVDGGAGYTRGSNSTYAAPSNIDLIDFDQDGDLDILVGYFVSADSDWHTSSFQLFRNEGGVFSDVTDELAPFQPSNRDVTYVEGAMKSASIVDVNMDGAPDLLLALNLEDNNKPNPFAGALYLNTDGVFLPPANRINGMGDMRYMDIGDFNCDGRTDIFGVGADTASTQQILFLLAKAD